MTILKIEKQASEVILTLQKRRWMVTSSLIAAFTLAFLLHLTLFIVFQLVPFSFYQSNRVLPYLPAIADPNLPKLVAQAEVDLPWFHELEELLETPVSSEKPFSWTFPMKSASLIALEAENQEDVLDVLVDAYVPQTPLSFSYPTYTLVISNGFKEPKYDPVVQIGSVQKQFRVLFNIEVDGDTGKIAWFERQISSQIKRVDDEAEKLLLSLQFEPSIQAPFIKGWIEVTVRA